MTVLVCGGRDFADRDALYVVLDRFHAKHPIDRLVHGAARGADTLAAVWALGAGVFSQGYPAQWDAYGKAAGAIRNQEMLDVEKIDVVVVCPGGRGTADMIRRATKAGVPMLFVNPADTLTDAVVDAFLAGYFDPADAKPDAERIERIRTLFDARLSDESDEDD